MRHIVPRNQNELLTRAPVPQREVEDNVILSGISTFPAWVTIKTLAFDFWGRLWGCGQGGVVRWTLSSNQITYRTWHIEHGLASNDAVSLFPSENKVFVGHALGEISLYQNRNWHVIDTKIGCPIRGFAIHGSDVIACLETALYNLNTGDTYSIPEPALCIASDGTHILLGTGSGVWTFKNNSWQLVELEKSLIGINQIVVTNDSIWIAGINGILHFKNDNRTFYEVASPINQLSAFAETALVATDQGLLGLSNSQQKMLYSVPASLVAMNSEARVFGTSRTLRFMTRTYDFEIIPTFDDEPDTVCRIFATDKRLWAQSNDGILWYCEENYWKRVASLGHACLTHVIESHNGDLVCFESKEGFGRYENDKLVFNNELKHVRAFYIHSDHEVALTYDALYVRPMGGQWIVVDLSEDVSSILRLISVDSKVHLVTTRAIYVMSGVSAIEIVAFEKPVGHIIYDEAIQMLYCYNGSQWLEFEIPIQLPLGAEVSEDVIRHKVTCLSSGYLPIDNLKQILGITYYADNAIVSTTKGIYIIKD